MALDLSKATPQERASCFGEAFRDVEMIEFDTDDAGTLRTGVILDGQEVLLIGDPEGALAYYQCHKDLGIVMEGVVLIGDRAKALQVFHDLRKGALP